MAPSKASGLSGTNSPSRIRGLSWAHIVTLMVKELKQILADKSVLIIAFFLPLMLVFIYGSGIRMDVKPVQVAVVSSKLDDVVTREVTFALAGSPYFRLTTLSSVKQAQELLLAHDIAAYITIPNNIAQSLYHQPAEIFITLNGADPQQASIARSYLEAVLMSSPTQKGLSRQVSYLATANAINQAQALSQNQALSQTQALTTPSSHSSSNRALSNSGLSGIGSGNASSSASASFRFNLSDLTGTSAATATLPASGLQSSAPTSAKSVVVGTSYEPVSVISRNWFNESNDSTWYLMAGQLIGVITIMSSFMSSIVIAREFERGTMSGLLATNATAGELFISKLVPYYVLSCLGASLAISVTLICYELPFRGNPVLYVITIAVYLYVTVLIGLIISALTQNQFLSSEYAIIISFLPSILLSGAVFDLRSVPDIVSTIAHVFPPTYAVQSSKICILSGGSSELLTRNIAILLLFALGGTLLCYRVLARHFHRYHPQPVAAAGATAPSSPDASAPPDASATPDESNNPEPSAPGKEEL